MAVPEFVQQLDPDLFCEAIALALEIPSDDCEIAARFQPD